MANAKLLAAIPSLQVLDNAIENGIKYLRSVTNANGGMPNHSPGNPSGAWTTCEVLSIIWQIAPSFDTAWMLRLADYVLHAQFEDGSWPIVDRSPGTTASTAAGILATLSMITLGLETRNFLLSDRATAAVDKAIQWLCGCQNKDFGWGMVKSSGQISRSRLSATSFALRALSANPTHPFFQRAEEMVKKGLIYLEKCQNPDGGWGEMPGRPSMIATTAKALDTLYKLGVDRDSSQIIKGISFITNTPDNSPALALLEETIGEAGSIIVHHNTPFGLLKVLLAFKVRDQRVKVLSDWFIKTQLPDGSWKLRCYPTGIVRPASIWPTAEAVYILNQIRSVLATDPGFLMSCSSLE